MRAERSRVMRAVVSMVAVALLTASAAWAESGGAAACAGLMKLSLAETTIESAAVVPAGTLTLPKPEPVLEELPEFCRVVGVTRPAIRFEVWLPTTIWNGKFEGVGNGGTAGFISYRPMALALRRGYATASTDTGHVNHPYGNGFDASWARGRPDLVRDFGWRALHVTTVNAKAVVAAFYGAAARRAYYVGCSQGGGQGLMEAQRFPADYDGLLVGDPANNWTRHYIGEHLWYSVATLKDPESYIPASKVSILANAVNKACDAKDGVRDGVVSDPLACKFDPAVLVCKVGQNPATCLTAKQVAAVKAIWGGARDSSGRLINPGLVQGGEGGPGGWARWVTGTKPFGGTHWKAADAVLKDMVFDDPEYNSLDFNFDTDTKLFEQKIGPAMDAVDPDLRPMERRGAKMILYHGWSDPDISPLNTIDYYNDVEKTVGVKETGSFLRLFMVPGMQHCGGGPGATTFDGLTALERWVEDGVAPERILAAKIVDGAVEETRPLCAYPKQAVYAGKGNTSDAENFRCEAR
ncbi:tannase/feruloyl esterase family alpha/beta hydrolase [Edaphobacter sp.]|uniref:tannase/feruloyl esterase family alpha/beta hydrolase n=1 Tax=Edaphobacter sp. TaxID=1934404 RepID=UPI002DBDC80F|nr:tannase/feruloyl esterase family alpha/beta hydrolase [Edaphobacter sp.]HEU5342192.1 tannase/feruloyl esterase family alpha/beta hydrolase [Edaphobacter sp.]